ncbi:MAG: hypothetical protein U1G08_06745 [Verrucomicrobiota bacterium]
MYSRGYPGVDKTLPNHWLRLRRVGDYFSAYVGTDGLTWSLVGQRYQQWPATLLVGAYSSASYVVTDGVGSGGQNLATVKFSNYGNAVLNDTQAPTLVSVGTADKKIVGVKFSRRWLPPRHWSRRTTASARARYRRCGPALAVTRCT